MSTEVRLLDDAGSTVAFGYAGFNRQTRRPGDNPKPDIDAASRRLRSIVPLDQPLADAAGVRVLDAATGATHTELVETLRNPAGALQGAMVSIVGEVAAEALLEHHGFTAHVITDIDIRYLAMGRVGPIGSRAWFIGDAGDESPPPIAVELYDRGQDDRLITTMPLRGAPTT